MKMKAEEHKIEEPMQSPQPAWLSIVRRRVSGLRFGMVQIVVHEGRVTQVDSTERTRLPADETFAA
jgi:hypothetical protein